MSELGPRDIDLSRLQGNPNVVVTWKGRKLEKEWFDLEVGKKSTKVIALALEKIIERDGAKCVRCGKNEWLTVDHIIPWGFLQQMGIERSETYRDFDNLQLMCKRCNGLKADRFDWADPRTKPLLLKYIEQM